MEVLATPRPAPAANLLRPAAMSKIHPDEVPGLTGLRFLAAFSVLFAHGTGVLLQGHDYPGSVAYWCTQASGFGMTLFFVLSGFVIHYNYAVLVTGGRLRGIAAYLWARFARLYPLYLLTLLGYVLISRKHFDFWFGDPAPFRDVLRALPYFLFSLQSWFYVPIGDTTLVYAVGGATSVTWSISTEWFFYFTFPLVALLVLRSRSPRRTIVLVLAWCALWIALTTSLFDRASDINAWALERYGPIAEMRQPRDEFAAQDSYVFWLLSFSPYFRMGEFVLGSLIAQLYLQLRDRKVGTLENTIGTAAFIAAVISVFIIGYFEFGPEVGTNIFRKMYMNFALAPSAALLIFCAARYRNMASRLLTSRPALLLGDASYSIYLTHFLVLMVDFKLFGPPAQSGTFFNILVLGVTIVATLLLSIGLYTYYEAPARRWLRQMWRDRA
jgi:peptidoglycan/LPS O-acetylase OafA/YrhL